MIKVVLTRGLPGSGKSYWAKNLVLKEAGRWVRVNKDDLRAMMHSSKYSKDNEKLVLAVRNHIILEAVKSGKHVIVDDTNFSETHFNCINQLVKGLAEVSYNNSFLEISLETCIKNDLNRPCSVGKDVIMRMYNQFLRPKAPGPEYNPDLPDCIICDMDGTLSLLNGRNPYDAKSCDADLVNYPVAETVTAYLKRYVDRKLVVFSGREGTEDVIKKTTLWLKNQGFEPEIVSLRKPGDMRKDSVVKKEMYEEHILGKRNVRFVFDDRLQVVNLWRDLGLVCFQVAEGDF